MPYSEPDTDYAFKAMPPGQNTVVGIPSGWTIPFDSRWYTDYVQPWLDAGNTLLPYDPPGPGPWSGPVKPVGL